jgi:hypothetical protein
MNDSDDVQTPGPREPGLLPRDIAPRTDLWPAIAEAIRQEEASPRSPPQVRSRTFPIAAAAAVSFLVIGFWLGRAPVSVDGAAGVADNRHTDAAAFIAASMGPDYPALRSELLRQAIPALESLSGDERAEVKSSLTDIRNAVEELESALGKDPTNALLQALLVQTVQEEMRVLGTLESLARPDEEMTL